jgi:hypothetical protein
MKFIQLQKNTKLVSIFSKNELYVIGPVLEPHMATWPSPGLNHRKRTLAKTNRRD